MKTRWLIYILLGVFLSSCYKEENIEGEEDEPKYKVEDSEDPLDHFIYGFYHDYGVFILYDYEEVDYRWNMSTVLDVELIKQTDKVTLNEGLAYLDNVLFQYYTDDFKKHYFPFKILLPIPTLIGASRWRGKVQAAFWANFLYNNEMMDLPEAFWNISEDYYGGNLKLVDGNSGLKPDEIDMKKYGFWDRDRTADNGTNYCMAPNKTLDINQFIDMVTTHTTAEMEALIAPYTSFS